MAHFQKYGNTTVLWATGGMRAWTNTNRKCPWWGFTQHRWQQPSPAGTNLEPSSEGLRTSCSCVGTVMAQENTPKSVPRGSCRPPPVRKTHIAQLAKRNLLLTHHTRNSVDVFQIQREQPRFMKAFDKVSDLRAWRHTCPHTHTHTHTST
jgi:hypothetical protein